MLARVALLALSALALPACSSAGVRHPRAGAAALQRFRVAFSVVPDPSVEVDAPPDSKHAVTSGGPKIPDWAVSIDDDLEREPVLCEAVVLHELWHVLTDNEKAHSKTPGDVAYGVVGPSFHPLEPTRADVASTTGRSFDVSASGAPPWLRRALRKATSTWNRALGREALYLVDP